MVCKELGIIAGRVVAKAAGAVFNPDSTCWLFAGISSGCVANGGKHHDIQYNKSQGTSLAYNEETVATDGMHTYAERAAGTKQHSPEWIYTTAVPAAVTDLSRKARLTAGGYTAEPKKARAAARQGTSTLQAFHA
jgi:hypothetical protein